MGVLEGWREVAQIDLARRARDPLGFAIWLGIPLVIATVLQLAFGGGGGDDGGSTPKADVLLAVQDGGFLEQMAPFLLSGGGQAPLDVEAVSVESGRERIALGEADAYVELPPGFLAKLFNDEPQAVAVLTHPARRVGPALATGMLEALVEAQRLTQQILGEPLRELVEREADAFASGPNPANVALVGAVVEGVMDRSAPLLFPPALKLERVEPVAAEAAAGEEPGLSGMALIFFPSILFLSLFFLAGGLAEDLWTEKSAGTLARALATPLRGPAWAFGKLAGTAVLHAVVATGAFGLAIAALDLPWVAALRGLPWAIACGVSLSAFMLVVQSLAKSARGGSLLGNLVTLPLLMLGGAFFPFEAMPAGLAALGARLPNGWMLLQLKAQLAGELSAAQLAVNFGALLIGTLGLALLLGWRLDGTFGKGGA